MTIDELRDYAESLKLHICHWFTVNDLMFLKRGGRVSAATAIVGSVLSIKPVMHMDNEGHLIKVDVAPAVARLRCARWLQRWKSSQPTLKSSAFTFATAIAFRTLNTSPRSCCAKIRHYGYPDQLCRSRNRRAYRSRRRFAVLRGLRTLMRLKSAC